MTERDHGWPEGYNWPEYLEGEMEVAKANKAEELLRDKIAPLQDKEEQQRAVEAWRGLGAQGVFGSTTMGSIMENLEDQ